MICAVCVAVAILGIGAWMLVCGCCCCCWWWDGWVGACVGREGAAVPQVQWWEAGGA